MSALHFVLAITFVALLLSFALPLIFLVIVAKRRNCVSISRAFDVYVSASVGVALAHWMLRIVPFAKMQSAVINTSVPVDDTLFVLGFFFWHILDSILTTTYTEGQKRQEVVERRIPWRTHCKYRVRPMNPVAYIELLLLGSGYAATEGFKLGTVKDVVVERYLSSVSDQMLFGAVIGVSALRTCYGIQTLVRTAVVFPLAMSLGTLFGTVASKMDKQWHARPLWILLAYALPGAHMSVLLNYMILPEVRAKRGVGIYGIGLGVSFWLIAAFPLYNV